MATTDSFGTKNNKSGRGELYDFNNADSVIEELEAKDLDYKNGFLTMVQGNTFGGVNISDENIRNNSHFIVNLWG